MGRKQARRTARRRSERRLRAVRRRRSSPGAPPGTIQIAEDALETSLHVLGYGPDGFEERDLGAVEQVAEFRKRWPVVWLQVVGLGSKDTLIEVGRHFALHPLLLEDVVNTHQRMKIESYGDVLFVVMRVVSLNAEVTTDQLSMVLGRGFVVTFQERPSSHLTPIEERIRNGRPLLCRSGSDVLAYAAIDAVVDHYFPVLDRYDELIDKIEDEALRGEDEAVLRKIHGVKSDLLTLRRTLWPLRETLAQLERDGSALLSDETRVYLRDCYDHSIHLIEILETYREICSGLTEVYLSSVSNRTNEVMRTLTVFAALFIPLTFVAGLYGMNFDRDRSPLNMPELAWYYGYPFALTIMVVMTLAMLRFFWRKGWIGRKGSGDLGPESS